MTNRFPVDLAMTAAVLLLIARPADGQDAPANAVSAARPEPAVPTRPALALKGGLWFDGSDFVPAEWYSVDGRLTATRPARIDAEIDLSGRYVLPPLADAHNHDLQNARFAAGSIGKNLRQGVFYSVQMCTKGIESRPFSALLNTPGTLDVLYADACISASDGHPLGMYLASVRDAGMEVSLEEARLTYDPIDSLADLDRAWPAIAARRPSLIKLILVNSDRQAENRADSTLFGYRGLDPELVAPIVERAHAAGIRVAAHTDNAADFATAVASGVDIVAHLPGFRFVTGLGAQDYRIADGVIAEAARRGTIVITTAALAARRRGADNAAALRATQVDNLRRLRAADVTLAIGSDNVMGTAVDEILYLDGLGIMPRAELLRRAVTDTPRSIFPDRAIGGFHEGSEASLVAYVTNPLESLEALRAPAIRVKQGSLLSN